MTSAPSSRNRITVTQYSRSSKPSATRTTILLPLSFTSLLFLKLPSMLSLFRGPTSSFLLGHLHRRRRLCPSIEPPAPSLPGRWPPWVARMAADTRVPPEYPRHKAITPNAKSSKPTGCRRAAPAKLPGAIYLVAAEEEKDQSP